MGCLDPWLDELELLFDIRSWLCPVLSCGCINKEQFRRTICFTVQQSIILIILGSDVVFHTCRQSIAFNTLACLYVTVHWHAGHSSGLW